VKRLEFWTCSSSSAPGLPLIANPKANQVFFMLANSLQTSVECTMWSDLAVDDRPVKNMVP